MLLAGCAAQNMVWVRPGTSAAQFDADRLRCEYEAEFATGSYNPGAGMPPPRTVGDAIGQGIASGFAMGTRQAGIAASCMRARGYVLVPRDQAPEIMAAQPAPVMVEQPQPVAMLTTPAAPPSAPPWVPPPASAAPDPEPELPAPLVAMARNPACSDPKRNPGVRARDQYTIRCNGREYHLQCDALRCRNLLSVIGN